MVKFRFILMNIALKADILIIVTYPKYSHLKPTLWELIMNNGVACVEEEFLPDMRVSDVAERSNTPATAGTFLLRRSHYFNVSKTCPELFFRRSCVVIAFESASRNFPHPVGQQLRHWRLLTGDRLSANEHTLTQASDILGV